MVMGRKGKKKYHSKNQSLSATICKGQPWPAGTGGIRRGLGPHPSLFPQVLLQEPQSLQAKLLFCGHLGITPSYRKHVSLCEKVNCQPRSKTAKPPAKLLQQRGCGDISKATYLLLVPILLCYSAIVHGTE